MYVYVDVHILFTVSRSLIHKLRWKFVCDEWKMDEDVKRKNQNKKRNKSERERARVTNVMLCLCEERYVECKSFMILHHINRFYSNYCFMS